MLSIKNGLFKTENNTQKGKDILTGAAIGAGVGAVGGALYGYNQAQNEIQKVPIQTVEITKKEPIFENKEIGKIPKDQYVPNSWWWGNKIDTTPTEPVYAKVPVKDQNGKVVYKEWTETVSGHGKPVVSYETKEVKEPVFKGFKQYTYEDTHTSCYTYKDTDYDGNTVYKERCTTYVDGIWIRFSPNVDYVVVDKYQVPQVKFEHGVDVFGKVMNGMLIGTALGAVIGGVTGAIINSISNIQKNKQESNENK